MTNDATHDLEDHIELLRKLDKKRMESAKLRDAGIDYLPEKFDSENLLEISNLNLLRALSRNSKVFSEDIKDDQKDPIDEFISKCGNLSFDEIHQKEKSVLYAAKLLQTLVAIPGGAHLKATFYCYYWIIRELYTADSAEWSIGGARAGKNGQVSAYITSECVNALLALAEAHKNTGEYLSKIGSFLERDKQLTNLENFICDKKNHPLTKWIKREHDKSARSCYLSLQRYSKHLTLELDDLPHKIELEKNKCFREVFLQKCTQFESKLKDGISISENHIGDVIDKINTYRNGGPDEGEDKMIRSYQGHHIAKNAISEAWEQSKAALKFFSSDDNINIYKESHDILKKINHQIQKTLTPTQNYLSSILDRELAVGTELHYGQAEELAWAALGYGKLTKYWDKDKRLALATQRLMTTISDYGIFPNRRHFHFNSKKETSQTEASCAIGAFAQLLTHVRSVKIDDDIAKKLLRLLEDTRVITSKDGWRKDCSPVHWKSDPDATAQAVLALDEINSMLDERINHLILDHFSVKWPALDFNKTPFLDQLFYSDYGLRSIYDDNTYNKLKNIILPKN